MRTKINIYSRNSINKLLEEQLDEAPIVEWWHIPIIKETTWSKPDWSVVMTNGEAKVICFLNIVEREAIFDGVKVKIAGINHLITTKSFRGKGHGKAVMEETHRFVFNKLKVKFALLLCGDDVAKFYEKLGWKKFKGQLVYNQPSLEEKVVWKQNVFIYTQSENRDYRLIDLCGLPW